MSAPARPVHIDASEIAVHITSPSSAADLTQQFARHASHPVALQYAGPVGELRGEHLFKVVDGQGHPVKRDDAGRTVEVRAFLEELKQEQGVKGVKVLEQKQRVKRGDDL